MTLKKQAKRSDDLDTPEVAPMLHDHGIHLLNGEFDYTTAQDAITWLLESGLRKKKLQHLTMIINSNGGDLNCAFAIIDMMRASPIPVHTVGIGEISSCGLITFLAGEKGHRILTPNTTIMSHQWSGAAFGKAHDLIAAQKDFTITTDRVLAHYRYYTGLDDDTIKEKLLPPHDVYLTADEAFQLNLCDSVRLIG